jgi:hypothetical protein
MPMRPKCLCIRLPPAPSKGYNDGGEGGIGLDAPRGGLSGVSDGGRVATAEIRPMAVKLEPVSVRARWRALATDARRLSPRRTTNRAATARSIASMVEAGSALPWADLFGPFRAEFSCPVSSP